MVVAVAVAVAVVVVVFILEIKRVGNYPDLEKLLQRQTILVLFCRSGFVA